MQAMLEKKVRQQAMRAGRAVYRMLYGRKWLKAVGVIPFECGDISVIVRSDEENFPQTESIILSRLLTRIFNAKVNVYVLVKDLSRDRRYIGLYNQDAA